MGALFLGTNMENNVFEYPTTASVSTGAVILYGPEGTCLVFTSVAARTTGKSLIEAGAKAEVQL